MNLNSDKARWGILIIAGVLLTVLVYGQIADQIAEIEQSTPSVPVRWHSSSMAKAAARIANPASNNCTNLGGQVQFEADPNGGQYGVCVFPNGGVCEEWSLLRGECAIGGVDVTPYRTPQSRYCVIRGGTYKVLKQGDIRTEVGTCTPYGGGESCDASAFWFGKCPVQ